MTKTPSSKYTAKLQAAYADIPEDKRIKADEYIQRLSDVLSMMDECKKHIKAEGCVSEMSQGAYSITRENPWSKVYDAKHRLMLSTFEKLDAMLPEQEGKADELTDFLDADGG